MSDAPTLVETLLGWVVAHPDVASALLAALLGSGHAVRQYRRTGSLPLASLPWRAIRRLGYAVRKRWFTYPKPGADALGTVDEDLETVARRLGRQSYELAWPFSYHYKGEDLNARRYYYAPDAEYPHRQVHVRAWDGEAGTEIDAHEEPSALHHPRVHLRSTEMTDATDWVVAGYGNGNGLDPRGFDS